MGIRGSGKWVLLSALVVALIASGCSSDSDTELSGFGAQPVGKDTGYRACYWKVVTYLKPSDLKDADIRMIGSVNLTMSKYVDAACSEAPNSETVDSVASYALDKAYIDQSGF